MNSGEVTPSAVQAMAQKLAESDSPEDWSSLLLGFPLECRSEVFAAAEPLWISRMVGNGRLLIHPEVARQLSSSNWRPSDVHRRMIWASVLANLRGDDSKARFLAIKARILKKHGFDWWKDVDRRVKHAYAARMRLEKAKSETGPALSMMAANSSIFALALHEERQRAYEMIPKE